MKLGSLKEGGRDGTLIVVSRDLARAVKATGIAPTMQRALEEWESTAPRLNSIYEVLNLSPAETINGEPVFAVDFTALASPLPRAYEFVDGSAYLPHVARVRKARGADVPESFYTDPLMYQGVSAGFHGPRDPVRVTDEAQGIDLEAEVVVVTDDVNFNSECNINHCTLTWQSALNYIYNIQRLDAPDEPWVMLEDTVDFLGTGGVLPFNDLDGPAAMDTRRYRIVVTGRQ